MSDVIFKEQTTTHGEPTESEFVSIGEPVKSEEISKEWLKAAKDFLGESLEYDTLEEVESYRLDNQVQHKHPTTHELANYMGRSYSAIQPRTSELKDKMLITEAGKRPCTCQKCVKAREEQGKPEISVTTWKVNQ